MASEKAMYWLAVCVLAFGVMNGFANEHKGWVDRLVDGSITMAEQASETGMQYADLVAMRLDRSNRAFDHTPMAVVPDIACVKRALARRQATMARRDAERIRVQVMQYGPGEFISCPRQQVVIADNTF